MEKTANHKKFESIVASIEGANLSNLFGKPCGKLNKKAFIAFHKDQLVFRIGSKRIEEQYSTLKEAVLWDPSGKHRPMKDWLMVSALHQTHWPLLAEQATAYLSDK